MQRALSRFWSKMSSPPHASTSTYIPPQMAPILPSSVSNSIPEASHILKQGGLVAFPTETVYGLGASALSQSAVQSIYKAKGRPSDNPLIVHVCSREMMIDLLPGREKAIPAIYEPLIKTFWPGALTLIFGLEEERFGEKAKRKVVEEVMAGQKSLAVRMPSHSLALRLIEESNLPLAAPSANLSSRPSPTTAKHVQEDLGEGRGLGAILDGGECEVGLESTVVDFVKPTKEGEQGELRVLRAGGVTPEEIGACLEEAGFGTSLGQKSGAIKVYSRDFKSEELEAKPTTPGMKYKHYAPTNSRVVLVQLTTDDPDAPSLYDLIKMSARAALNEDEAFTVGLMLTSETLDRLTPTVVQSITPSCSCITLPTPIAVSDSSEDDDLPPPKTAPILYSYSLGSSSRPIEAGQRLFAGLRYLDSLAQSSLNISTTKGNSVGVDLILIEAVDETGVGLAVMERARKSAGGAGAVQFRV